MRSGVMLLCTAGVLAMSSAAQAQERVVNGNFGSFTAGSGATAGANIPNGGWFPTTGNGAMSSQATANSPFTNAYANNNSSWLVQDPLTGSYNTAGDGLAGWETNGWTPTTTALVNFDFMEGSVITGQTWGVQFNNNPGAVAAKSVVQFRIDQSFAIQPTGGTLNTVAGLTLAANTWYNVQATIDVLAGTYSGTITPWGGSGSSFSGSDIATTGSGAPNPQQISGVQVRDRVAGLNGDLYLDNFSVVPEPATLSLLAMGGLLLCRRRK